MTRFRSRVIGALRLLTGARHLSNEEREMRDEMRFHVDMHTRKNVAAGMSPDAARRAAVLAFGGEARWKEDARDEIRSRPLDDFVRDVAYGIRTLRRDRGFAAVAVLTLALGIAATVTAFSFVDSAFLRPLSVPTGRRLVRVYFGGVAGDAQSLRYAGYTAVRQRVTAFDQVVAHYSTAPLYVRINDESREIQGAVVSASYFPALGLEARLGRFFTPSEDAVPDRDFVAVIGYGLWQSRFGADPNVIGRTMGINGRTFTIIGVAPEGFDGVLPSWTVDELWMPLMTLHVGYRWCDGFQPTCGVVDVIARLARDATLEQARGQLATIAPQLIAGSDPSDSLSRIVVEPLVGEPLNQQHADAGLAQLLSAIAITLLLVACANMAGLMLARGLAREREIAVRRSLGAARGRIVRQLLAENLIIAALGGGLGVIASTWTSRALVEFFAIDQEGYSHHFDVAVNAHVLWFAAAISMVTALVFGLLPALETSRADSAMRLRGGGGTRENSRLRLGLVATQTAMCVMMLVAASLLTRSFARVAAGQNLDPSHVALLRLRPRLVGYDAPRAQRFLRQATRNLEALPEVEGVALARGTGEVWKATGDVRVARPGDAPVPAGSQLRVGYHEISPAFFSTLKVPLVRGREFTERDGPDAPRVVMVNESFARRLQPDGAVIGQTLLLDDHDFQIVGIVHDYHAHTAGQATPSMAYVPFWQNDFEPQIDARLAVRLRGGAQPALAYPALRRAIAAADPAVPVTETVPMTEQIAANYARLHVGGTVLIVAAGLALFLSAIGLYGVVAFLVARRTREVGVRLALGARPSQVVTTFVAHGMRPMLVGAVAGIVVAAGGGRVLAGWLFGVEPLDAVAFGTAGTTVVVVALLASWIPARRAARVDPVVALRSE